VTVSVLVPFNEGECEQRDRVWEWVHERLELQLPDAHVIIAGDDDPPWSKGTAVRNCLRYARGDVIVVHDADSTVDNLADAVEVVEMGAAWCVPHSRIVRLNEHTTGQWLTRPVPHRLPAVTARHRERYAKPSVHGGGVTVLQRKILEDVPVDPRFRGWGGEDLAWGRALGTLHGEAVQLQTDLIHLWHPPRPEHWMVKGTVLPETQALADRYCQANGDPAAVRRLLAEVTL
jgi:hypothetical protein